jgi:DNA-binding NtrC family response regulator
VATRLSSVADTPPAETAKASVLIVDDELLIRETLAEFLGQEGFAVETAGDGERALNLAGERGFELAICDIQLPGMDGVELLERLLKISPETFVLLITAYGTVESAVEAFKRGAHDYLMKPLIFDEVLAKIRHLLRYRELFLENQWLRRELHRQQEFRQIVGRGPAMRQVLAMVAKVARTRSNVLLIGPSGTGKELIARAIHQQGPDAEQKFIAINCAAIPHDLMENQLFGHRKGAYTGADRDMEGVFLHAGHGTIFLDEIAELSLGTQAKLLRAIEEKEVLPVGAAEPVRVNPRILAATNKDLAREVEQGRFREDLYYRLNVVTIALPPLGDRREDIPDLVDYLLARHVQALGKRIAGVDHEAMRILMSAPWRGNIRELDNALQRAVILGEGPLITPADLPPGLAPSPDVCLSDNLRETLAHFERRHIEHILHDTPDKKEAAKRLGLALSSLYRKIEELGIRIEDRRSEAAN